MSSAGGQKNNPPPARKQDELDQFEKIDAMYNHL
jgi:hypothetical protein